MKGADKSLCAHSGLLATGNGGLRIHSFDFRLQLRGDSIASELTIRGQQSALDRKCLFAYNKLPYLLVMREPRIDTLDCRLHLLPSYFPGDDRRKISTTVPHQHGLVCRR